MLVVTQLTLNRYLSDTGLTSNQCHDWDLVDIHVSTDIYISWYSWQYTDTSPILHWHFADTSSTLAQMSVEPANNSRSSDNCPVNLRFWQVKAQPGRTPWPGISAKMKNILTGNLWPNMGQVILLYCHTILWKKLCYRFCFYSNSKNFITRSALSQMLCRIVLIVNTSHQRHYSYMLIYAFCGGVVKDREAPFSLNYVHLKNY